MRSRRRRPWIGRLWQIVCALLIVALGSLIIASKLAAQGQPQRASSARPSAAVAPPLASVATPTTSAGPAASAPNTSSSVTKDDDPVNSTTADAVIQSNGDLSDLGPEDIDAIVGKGKVPIHRSGRYRSPLANPSFGGPAIVKVGFVISEIRDYQIQDGSFSADYFMSFTADKTLPKLHPVFTNGHDTNCIPIVDVPVPTFRFYRCTGTFTSPVDLLDYPFDTQTLDISMEDAVYGVDTIVFEADPLRTSLDANFRISGYSVAKVGASTFKHQYPSRFDRDDLYVSRYRFTVALDRFAQSAAFSVFFPAFVIVIISLIGLWVPPEELEVRSNAGAPMLAAAVLFHYALVQSLPATGYLTHADKLMLGVYVSLLMNMATTWVFMVVDEERVQFWFRFFRAWTPPATVLVMAVSVLA
ncbi:MAG TPA: hypothetical protein VFK05_14115 [Polyangiaceae bacterium]|nr:hypothetical protein [Polyangiaceae bacterium]